MSLKLKLILITPLFKSTQPTNLRQQLVWWAKNLV